MSISSQPTVKVMGRMPHDLFVRRFARQLPGNGDRWGGCRFIFDWETMDYDWLVVYHDLFPTPGKPCLEKLACPRENTILVTTEPSTITVFGTDYLRQYGTIITSQEPWVIKHPNVIYTHPGLIWLYGIPFESGRAMTYDELKDMPQPQKNRVISTFCSNKTGNLTLHTRRVEFTRELQAAMPELEVFGHGVRTISDKVEALDPYRYHIVIENHVFQHHLTEKLPDAFLGYTLPFYHGCPNATDYFPAESFVPIDINDFNRTREIIASTIANNEYEDRLPYIIKARQQVLEEHNFFAVVERTIHRNQAQIGESQHRDSDPAVIMNRRTLRLKKPLQGIRSLVEKAVVKTRHFLKWHP